MRRNATSTKPPVVKAAVIARYTGGSSKAQIARELGIDRETVTRILTERGELALLATQVIERRLAEKGSGYFALRVLKKMGFFDRPAPP